MAWHMGRFSNFFWYVLLFKAGHCSSSGFDIFLGELSEAFEKKDGMHFGLYYSLYEWFHPLYLKDKRNDFNTQDFIKVRVIPYQP